MDDWESNYIESQEKIRNSEYGKRKESLGDKYYTPKSKEQRPFDVLKIFLFTADKNKRLSVAEIRSKYPREIEIFELEEVLIELEIRGLICSYFNKDFSLKGYCLQGFY